MEEIPFNHTEKCCRKINQGQNFNRHIEIDLLGKAVKNMRRVWGIINFPGDMVPISVFIKRYVPL